MAGLNFIGSYSGIDSSAIEQLLQAEKLPLVQLSNKKTDITAKQNAWKDINTRLNTLFDKLKALQNKETYTAMTASSTNDKVVTMTASKNAVAGTYKINVEQLATSTTIISSKKITSIVEGSFTISNHNNEVSKAIEISEFDTLQDIAIKINEAAKDTKDIEGNIIKGTGIKASIIDDRLVLIDEKTGERNITFSGNSDVLNSLHLQNATVNDLGKNAIFTINGVEVERSTNVISDAINGLTINLNKEHEAGQYDTVTISQDTAKLTKAIQDFVDQYNSTMTFIESKLSAGNPDIAGSRGTLSGDSSLQRLHSSLRNLVTSSIGNSNTDIKDISQLGVTTIDKFGQLQFNSSKLTEALEKNPQNVMNFFTSKNADNEEIGFAERLKNYVDSFISSKDGIIKGKNDSFDKTLRDLNRQIDRFNDRIERKEAYYTKMFAALDVALMQSESQMAWLQGQIQAMNAQAAANKK